MTDPTVERERSDRESVDASRSASDAAALTSGRPAVTRRGVLATTGGALAGTAGLVAGSTPSRAQEEETTDDTQARITTTMAIEDTPEFDGPYGSQFVVIQSTEYDPERTPGLEDCSGIEWTLQNTKSLDGVIVDRLSQNPEGFETTVHIGEEDREFRPGQTFVVSDATECGDYVALGVEGVGPLSVAGKETVGTVDEDGGGGGGGDGPTPGFSVGGAVAALGALLGAGAARRASDDE